MERFSVYLTSELLEELRSAASDNYQSTSVFIRTLIVDYLKKNRLQEVHKESL